MKNSPATRLARALACLALLYNAAALAQQTGRAHQQDQSRPAGQKGSPADAPQEIDGDEVIKLDTNLVQLHAVVTDKSGRPVGDLTRDDFEVFEDGKPQQISFFSVVRAGGEASPQPEPRGVGRRAPARSIVLFVDTLHMSNASLYRAKKYMHAFVDKRMTDSDSVMVVATSGTLGVLQQFMSDRRMLHYAIDRLLPFSTEHTAFTPDLAAAVQTGNEGAVAQAVAILQDEEGYLSVNKELDRSYAAARGRDILNKEDRLRRATLQTLSAASDRLAAMKGQRLVAFVSDGFTNYDLGGGYDRTAFERAFGRMARAGVVVYSMYAMGLVASADKMTGVPSGGSQETLRDLAYYTGGEAFINTNDIGASFQKMLDRNSVYYSIAYYPPKGGDDLKYRKVSVRLKNRQGYEVRAQRGYVPAERRVEEASASPREKLFKDMIAPLPVTNVGVTSSAGFLETAGDDAQVTLQVHIGGDRLEYEKEGDAFRLRCEVVSVFFDKDGKIADQSAETMSALLTPAQLEEGRRAGYRYTRRVSLAPGLYQARVGVREVGSGLSGTSASWVEVPNLKRGRPTLSSIFLGRNQGETGRAAAGAAKADHVATPKLIAGDPAYKSGEPIFYRLAAYNVGGAEREAATTIKVALLREGDPVYEGPWQTLASRVVRRDAKGVELGGELRASLPPGPYTLRVTLKDAAGRTRQQEIDFQIE